MAKTRRYYYECVAECDLGFWGPDQRKERWIQKGRQLIQPARVQHSIRLSPSRGIRPNGDQIPPDYIVTDRPLGKQYTEEITKKVSRPSFDPVTGRRNGRYFRKKVSAIKFRLMDIDEVDSDIKKHAFDMEWQEVIYETHSEDVTLPKDQAVIDKADPEAIGEEKDVANG